MLRSRKSKLKLNTALTLHVGQSCHIFNSGQNRWDLCSPVQKSGNPQLQFWFQKSDNQTIRPLISFHFPKYINELFCFAAMVCIPVYFPKHFTSGTLANIFSVVSSKYWHHPKQIKWLLLLLMWSCPPQNRKCHH